MAQLGFFLGHASELKGATEESLSIAREIADKKGEAEFLYWLADITSELGDDPGALVLFEDALRLATDLDYGYLASGIKNDMAECLRAQGRYKEAEPLYEQAFAFDNHANSTFGAVIGLANLAMVSIQQGDIAAAAGRLIEAFAVTARSPYAMSAGQILLQTCAGCLAAMQDWSHAARLYGASEAQREQEGTILARADEQYILPLMAQARQALGVAEFGLAFAEGRKLASAIALSEAQAWLATKT